MSCAQMLDLNGMQPSQICVLAGRADEGEPALRTGSSEGAGTSLHFVSFEADDVDGEKKKQKRKGSAAVEFAEAMAPAAGKGKGKKPGKDGDGAGQGQQKKKKK